MKRRLSCVWLILAAAALLVPAAGAKVDLVTLPARDRVQLTIYNSADLTLARDIRPLTLRQGPNRLQFGWSGTLIDPTSLELLPLAQAGKIAVQSLEYPPRVQGLGIWNVDSAVRGNVPFEISYFTSGISWQAYYLATLAPDETVMRLEGYVRISNQSGEDYEKAETRLVVGKVNLLDRIAELARRAEPYGRPGGVTPSAPAPRAPTPAELGAVVPFGKARAAVTAPAPKEIVKEGLSEYFLYTIEGTEDIPAGWGKRLISFTADPVPVKNVFRYEEERYGNQPVRFLSFANDAKHRLGREPIPGGPVKVFRAVGDRGPLSYVGTQETKYVPKGGEVDLNLGASDLVSVEITLVEFFTDNHDWKNDSLTGWDEHRSFRVKVANFREVPAKVEIRRSFPTTAWELASEGEHGAYEKVDADTVQYTLDLPANARRVFTYKATLHTGTRAGR